jgi:hypothetical protein
MNPYKHLPTAAVLAALVVGAALTHKMQAEYFTFHVVGHLTLPPTKMPNAFHHLHVSAANGRQFVTVSNSDPDLVLLYSLPPEKDITAFVRTFLEGRMPAAEVKRKESLEPPTAPVHRLCSD